MKKVFFFAFMALSLSVMAQQHVKPLTVTIPEVKLDSLRTLYSAEPAMYRASLDVLAKDLFKSGEALRAAKAELREETAHAKEIDNTLKEATKTIASLKSLYQKEDIELKSMQKTIEQQQRTVATKSNLSKENKDNFNQALDKHQKDIGYAIREVAERQRSLADFETTVQNAQTSHQNFWAEINQKTTDIANMEAQLKERIGIVKAEQKTAKSMQ